MPSETLPSHRSSDCSVQFQRVLVPLDFSSASRAALRYAVDFVGQFGSNLTLLAVVPDQLTAFEYGEPQAINERERLKAKCRDQLSALCREYFSENHFDVRVEVGKPFEEIVRAAKGLGADLIIISPHGHTDSRLVELGSTAERVVRYAPCPVLVIRPSQVAASDS